MKWATKRRARTLLVSVAIVMAVVALVALLSAISNKRGSTIITLQKGASPIAPRPSQAQNNSAEIQPTPPVIVSPANNINSSGPTAPSGSPANFIIPVVGVRPEQLRDTFSEARSAPHLGRKPRRENAGGWLSSPLPLAGEGGRSERSEDRPGEGSCEKYERPLPAHAFGVRHPLPQAGEGKRARGEGNNQNPSRFLAPPQRAKTPP